MMRRLTLDRRTLSALAVAGGDSSAVAELRRWKVNDHRLLLWYLVTAGDGDPALAESFAALSAAESRSPQVVGDLLAHPWTGARFSGAARRWHMTAGPAPEDVGRLGALAAVATARSGGYAKLTAAVERGVVMLPDVGAITPSDPHAGTVQLLVDGSCVSVDSDRPFRLDSAEDWRVPQRLRLRRLVAECDGRRVVVALDDVDPSRHCFDQQMASRLASEEVERWGDLFRGAWALLVREAPDRAAEVEAGISVLAPLAPGTARTGHSATSIDVFGALALTRSINSAALAATLVHELQHAKLNVLHRASALYVDPGHARFHAPWRPDPRPIGGLLHGLYAFTGVADLWFRFRSVDGLEEMAMNQFARLREQVHAALGTVERSGILTETGLTFVAGLRGAIHLMMSRPVPGRMVRRARASLRVERMAWILRNRSFRGR